MYRLAGALLREGKDSGPNEEKAKQYIRGQLNKKEGATLIILDDFECVYYKRTSLEDDKEFIIYYWIARQIGNLFFCSFTVDKEIDETEQGKAEINTVQNIIKSIRLI